MNVRILCGHFYFSENFLILRRSLKAAFFGPIRYKGPTAPLPGVLGENALLCGTLLTLAPRLGALGENAPHRGKIPPTTVLPSVHGGKRRKTPCAPAQYSSTLHLRTLGGTLRENSPLPDAPRHIISSPTTLRRNGPALPLGKVGKDMLKYIKSHERGVCRVPP